MLRDIQELIRQRGRVSLRELCIHFHIDADALEPMMDILVRKRQVRRDEAVCPLGKGTCRGCVCADRQDVISYVPRDDADAGIAHP